MPTRMVNSIVPHIVQNSRHMDPQGCPLILFYIDYIHLQDRLDKARSALAVARLKIQFLVEITQKLQPEQTHSQVEGHDKYINTGGS